MNGDLTARMEVEVVRAKTEPGEILAIGLTRFFNVFISALIVWWLHRYVPFIPEMNYIQSVCLIVVARLLALPYDGAHRFWTKRQT